MEACGGAHHVARRLRLLGLDARLIAGQFVTPYRMTGKSGKNDANDAAAICEAAGRPHMRFVPVKTAEQPGQLSVHRLREGYKAERTALINRIRGVLAEFARVFPQSPEALRRVLADVLEDARNELTGITRLMLQRAQGRRGLAPNARNHGQTEADGQRREDANLQGPVRGSSISWVTRSGG
jgi:transposase